MARELIRILRSKGVTEVRKGKGSHVLYGIGTCVTVVPMHAGDIPRGTLRKIEADLAPCLGPGWLSR